MSQSLPFKTYAKLAFLASAFIVGGIHNVLARNSQLGLVL